MDTPRRALIVSYGQSALLLAGIVLGTSLPAPIAGHAGAPGSIAGRVEVVSKSTRKLATPGAYPGRTVTLPANRHTSELQNVIVFVDVPGGAPAPPTRAVIHQDREEFVPHVTAVTVGSTVEFPNDDPVFHNVFSLSRAATFDLGRYPRSTSKARTFDTPGIVKVFCHLHSHMSAVVRVFPHPHFVIPDVHGRFELTGLPPGPHTLKAWHERVGELRRPVSVVAGEPVEVSLILPVADEP